MAFSAKVAEAYCDMLVNEKPWHDALGRCQTTLNRFVGVARRSLGMLGFGQAISGVERLARSFSRLHTNVRATELAVRALGRALGALPTGFGAGAGSAYRGLGSGLGSMFAGIGRGLGDMFGKAAAGFGKGLGSVLSGFGTGLGSAIRGLSGHWSSIGLGLGRIATGFGNGLGKAVSGLGLGLSRSANGFGSMIQRITGGFSTFLSSIPRMVSAINPMNFLGGAGGLIAGVGAGLGAKFAIDEAMKMESSMTRLQRVTGLEGDSLAYLGNQLKRMSATMAGTSVEDIFGIATMGAKLGIEGSALSLFTSDMAKFSVVLEDMPIAEATTQVARLLAVFGRGPDEAARFASSLVRLDNASTASAREILDITQRLSGQASHLGMTPQKTMALAAGLREAGVPIETAGTAMSQLMVRMASKRDSAPFAKLAGMDVKSFQQKLVGSPLEAITAVGQGLGGMGKIEAEQYLDELHLDGQRVRGTLLQLVAILPKLSGFVKASEEDWSSLSAIQKGFNLEANTSANQLKLMWNNIKLLAAEAGTGLLPMLRGASSALGMMSGHLREFFERNREKIESFSRRVQAVFAQIGTIFSTGKMFKDYLYETITEKWEQGLYLARVGFLKFADFLEDLFTQVADNIGQRLTNSFVDVMVKFAMPLMLLGVNANHFVNLKKNPVPIKPKVEMFNGIMAGMPNRNQEQFRLWGNFRVAAKAIQDNVPKVLAGMDLMDNVARLGAQARRAGLAPVLNMIGGIRGAAMGAMALPFGKRNAPAMRVMKGQRAIAKRAADRAAALAKRKAAADKRLIAARNLNRKARGNAGGIIIPGLKPLLGQKPADANRINKGITATDKAVEKAFKKVMEEPSQVLKDIRTELKRPKALVWAR